VAIPAVTEDAVFLNIPYDENFERPYLAYIVGLVQLGLEPRVTLGVPGGERRLDRILERIQSCRYSIHDLSRVEVSRRSPRIPRFNTPFELGLTVAWAKLHPNLHTWFVCETERYRVDRSLSDLGGTDPNIHDGTVSGVMRELCNAFVRRNSPRPTQMVKSYRMVARRKEAIMSDAGADSLFEARVFEDLVFAAKALVEAL
jgi:hypothetical protein